MLGVRLTDAEGNPWQVVAADGGRWIIARTNAHEPVQSVTAADLAEQFTSGAGVPPVEPDQPSEADGWAAIGAANAEAAEALARGALPAAAAEPSPEDHFAGIERITSADAARLGHR